MYLSGAYTNRFSLLTIFLLLIYFLLLINNLSGIGLHIGDEEIYSNSVASLMHGIINNNNHPLLAKTIWYYFVLMYSGITGKFSPAAWRIGTIFLSLGSLVAFYKIARHFFTQEIAFTCAIILALDPMFFSFSRLMQLEIPTIFFLFISLHYLLMLRRNKNIKYFYLSGLFLGFSLACKLTGILLIITIPLYLLIEYKFSPKSNKPVITLKNGFFYIVVVCVAFILGNFIFFVKKTDMSFAYYVYELFHSQIGGDINSRGYQYSLGWSWFIIPQHFILYRMSGKVFTTTIVSFVNPLIAIFALFSFMFAIVSKMRKKIKDNSFNLLFVILLSLYIPWFFNFHSTYYYYSIFLTPFFILMYANLISKRMNTKYLLTISVLVSITIFLVTYPLLIGEKVSLEREKKILYISTYKHKKIDRLFCQGC